MLAVVALVATMSPITAAHAADNVTVRVVNNTGAAMDLWVDSLVKTQNLAQGGSIDIVTNAGSHDVVSCPIGSQATPSTAVGCNLAAPAPFTAVNSQTQFDWAGGTNNTVVFGNGAKASAGLVASKATTFAFTNDLSPTATGQARISLNNATGLPNIPATALNLCVDGQGQVITGTPALVSSATMAHGSEVEVPSGNRSVRFDAATNCVGATATQLDLAAGTNSVITVFLSGAVFQILNVDAVDVQNIPVQSAFCSALLSLQGITAQMRATFASVVAGDPKTTPSQFQVKSLVDTINAALRAGDQHVPDLQKGYWHDATAGLESLAGYLTSAGYDFNKLPAAAQTGLLAFINGTSVKTQEVTTATEALTAYAVANCLSASTVKGSGPKFTG
jgi:hypothetical protein